MRLTSHIRTLGAFLLALVITVQWLLQTGHVFFASHHHDEQQVCADQQYGLSAAKHHFHDAHFLSEQCDFCTFVLSAATLPEYILPVFQSQIQPETVIDHDQVNFLPDYRGFQHNLRGPPAV